MSQSSRRKLAGARRQAGMSLIELMIAMGVLMVGILGTAILIPLSIGSNFKNKQESNSSVMAQMVMDQIRSVPASTATLLTLTDCSGAAHSINTTGSSAGEGAPVLSSGQIDFSSATPAGYSMLYTTCGTLGREATYDVRWNIKTLSAYVKLVTISAKLKGSGTDPQIFALPITVRTLVGQGS